MDSLVYVAVKENGGIIGFASFGPDRQENENGVGELYAIYLLPEALNKRREPDLSLLRHRVNRRKYGVNPCIGIGG